MSYPTTVTRAVLGPQAPAFFVVAVVISFRGLVQLLSISTLLPGTRARYPGYVEPERNADDGSGEKNEPPAIVRRLLERTGHPGGLVPWEMRKFTTVGRAPLCSRAGISLDSSGLRP